MAEQQIPIIITKKGCHRCDELKAWLKEKKIKYIERDIDDEDFVKQLLQDQNFTSTFCDAEGCIVNTPAVLFKGKYWFKELWGISGLRKKEAEKIFLS
ncbi:MAG: glutaredoxin domain-containing protein [Promethearchaeia archaeon]